jgi:hypothetical protein
MVKKPMQRTNQSDRFIEAARTLGCDESEERFDAALKMIAKQKPNSTDCSKTIGSADEARSKALESPRPFCTPAPTWRQYVLEP